MKGSLNAELNVGDKVMCYHMDGEIGVPPGTIGKVTDVTTDPFEPGGDEKIISVKWENGVNLALISSTDSWKKIPSEKIDEQRDPSWEFLTQNSDLLKNFDWRWFKKYLKTIRDSGIVNMYESPRLLYAGKSHIERYYGEDMEDDDTEETNEEAKADFRNALVSLLGEDVSPSLVNQLEGIFEAVVADRVEKNVAVIVEKVDSNVKSYLENVTESLVEKVDDYLDYVVEEWMTENAVAVEQGVKTQIAENFISGLKNLFENHYIDVPAEKYNVLDELYSHNMELANRLNESMKVNMDLKKEVSLTECAGIFVAESRDLADTQVAKLQNLMESINFNTPEEYREKLVAIRENYLTRNRPAPTHYSAPEQTFSPVHNTPTTLVESYVGALGRLNKRV